MQKNDILKSFDPKDELCELVWDEKQNLRDTVKKKLINTAEEFIEFLEEKFFIDDITITGSLANYNWSKYSDFDLHLMINFDQFGDEKELYKKIFDLKKDAFNKKYNIIIKNHEVEVYAQDSKEEHYSSGVYSLVKDEWISKPRPIKMDIDKKLLSDKIKHWKDKIDNLIKLAPKEDLNEYKNKVKRLKEQIKKYRKTGLKGNGENSYENLVFKYLRRSGYIEKLYDSKTDKVSKELSLEYIDEQLTKFFNVSGEPKLIQDLKKMKSSITQLKKGTTSVDVENIQKALSFMGYDLPKYGIDGVFGSETENAIKSFQNANNIETNKDNFGVVRSGEIDIMINKLKELNFKDEHLTKRKYELPKGGDKFTYVDLNTPEGFKTYATICDNFIKSKNSASPINGNMMAESAKKYFYQGYVPPELACAQLHLEGGLSTNPNARPIKTKNPFNVGNVDTGQNKYMSSFQSGIDAYYNLMTKKYLPKGKEAESLLSNFVNTSGNRYASDKNYENKLASIVNQIA